MDVLNLYRVRNFDSLCTQVELLKAQGLRQGIQWDVEFFAHTAFSLYLLDSPLLDNLINLPLESLKYEDNTTWEWIRPLILLKVRTERVSRETIHKIWEAFDVGDEILSNRRKSVFKRFLDGTTIGADLSEIERCRNEKDEETEAFRRITLAMDLVVISEMGAGEHFFCSGTIWRKS